MTLALAGIGCRCQDAPRADPVHDRLEENQSLAAIANDLTTQDLAAHAYADRRRIDAAVSELVVLLARSDPDERSVVCVELEGLYGSRFERYSDPTLRAGALRSMAAVCESRGAARRARQLARQAANEAIAASETGRAVTYLEVLASIDREPGDADTLASVRAEVRDLLRSTALDNRRARFLRKLAPDWIASGWLSEDGERVGAEVSARAGCVSGASNTCLPTSGVVQGAARTLTARAAAACELAEVQQIDPPLSFEALTISWLRRDGENDVFWAELPLDELFLRVYEWDRGVGIPERTDGD